MPLLTAFKSPNQQDHKFKSMLNYAVRLCQKKKKKQKGGGEENNKKKKGERIGDLEGRGGTDRRLGERRGRDKEIHFSECLKSDIRKML